MLEKLYTDEIDLDDAIYLQDKDSCILQKTKLELIPSVAQESEQNEYDKEVIRIGELINNTNATHKKGIHILIRNM